jgi:hypothetical protein
MKTIYAARVNAPRPAQRAAAQQMIVAWLEENHPHGDRGAFGVRVADEDTWFRVSIDQHIDADLSLQTQIALRQMRDGLGFEARQMVVPRRVKVVSRKLPTPSLALRRLVQSVVDLIGAVDAGVPITSGAQRIDNEMDALGVAALCEAPSRSLPVLIETPTPAGELIFGAAIAAAPLAGLAHVVVFNGDRTRRAFNQGWGADLLAPGALVVVWPDRMGAESTPTDQRLSEQGARRELIQRIERITAVAAESLPVMPRSRPPDRRPPSRSAPATSAQADVDDGVVGADPDQPTVTMQELLGALDELEQAWDRVDDLQSALSTADAMLAETTARNDALSSRIDDLVSAKVDLEIRLGRKPDVLRAINPNDALEQARLACSHLDFVGDYSSLDELAGIDSTALLVDLFTLDSVAVQWRAGALNDTTFALACRNVGLDYAADVSDTARHEYADDYAITWQGETVLAAAHVRRGKGARLYRIHLHLDRERRRVVIGHIGRHLRGKRD